MKYKHNMTTNRPKQNHNRTGKLSASSASAGYVQAPQIRSHDFWCYINLYVCMCVYHFYEVVALTQFIQLL